VPADQSRERRLVPCSEEAAEQHGIALGLRCGRSRQLANVA
jgi:hypothetical protein